MSKIIKNDLGFLGLDYQLRLIAQLITDKKFANNILDIVDVNFFDDEYLKIIMLEIKNAYDSHQIIPDFNSLEFRIRERSNNAVTRDFILQQLDNVKKVDLNDTFKVQEIAMKFCKQQALKKSIDEIQIILERGEFDDYDECEGILKKALSVGDNKDDGIDVFDKLDEVLADDFRLPIATGIRGLDELMDGGLAKTELAIILAPFGVGKTTMMTKIANGSKNLGKNVLQIFFEDNPKIIQRKHLACWTGIELNELNNNRELVKATAIQKQNEPGLLKLKKFPSDGITIPKIKSYVRKLIASGFKPDIILIDYIDCVEPSRKFTDTNVGEGSVMREFETMLNEFDMAGWTAVQGNRSSIKAEVVESDQMGGSIKKAQIGHFILSIARSNDQKDSGHANLAILKSRFGKDGIILNDCIFNNATIQIEVTPQEVKTFLQNAKDKVISDNNRVKDVLESMQRARDNNNN